MTNAPTTMVRAGVVRRRPDGNARSSDVMTGRGNSDTMVPTAAKTGLVVANHPTGNRTAPAAAVITPIPLLGRTHQMTSPARR